jgi:hypothetical protein
LTLTTHADRCRLVGLPGMDGHELAAALRASHDVRLCAIT